MDIVVMEEVVAQRVQVMLVCDLHEDEVEGDETVSFGLDGTSYEIDVCQEHAAGLREVFSTYVGAARKAGRPGGSSARRAPRAVKPAASSGNERVQEIRKWARANGHQVSERGRLSTAVTEAYEAAH